jgi:hypothetical protein
MTRESLLRKVRALLQKTTANGAAEAEAANAMAMARRLMDEHAIEEAELNGGAGCTFREEDAWSGSTMPNHVLASVSVIEAAFHVKAVVVTRRDPATGKKIGYRVSLFGDTLHIEAARLGLKYLAPTMLSLWTRYRVASSAPTSHQVPYLGAMQFALLERFRSERQSEGTGRELAVIKSKLDREFEAANPDAREIVRSCDVEKAPESAMAAGYRDASEVTFAKGLGDGQRLALGN